MAGYSLHKTDDKGRHITVMGTAWDSNQRDFALCYDKPYYADYWSKGWVDKTIRRRLRENLAHAFTGDLSETGWYSVTDYVICKCYDNGKCCYKGFEYEMQWHVTHTHTTGGDDVQILFGGPCCVHVSEETIRA